MSPVYEAPPIDPASLLHLTGLLDIRSVTTKPAEGAGFELEAEREARAEISRTKGKPECFILGAIPYNYPIPSGVLLDLHSTREAALDLPQKKENLRIEIIPTRFPERPPEDTTKETRRPPAVERCDAIKK